MLGNFNQWIDWIDTNSHRQSIFETCVCSQFQEIIPILERSRHDQSLLSQGRNLGLSTHGLASPESMFLGGAAVHEPWLCWVGSWVGDSWKLMEVDGFGMGCVKCWRVEFIRIGWRKCLTCKNSMELWTHVFIIFVGWGWCWPQKSNERLRTSAGFILGI